MPNNISKTELNNKITELENKLKEEQNKVKDLNVQVKELKSVADKAVNESNQYKEDLKAENAKMSELIDALKEENDVLKDITSDSVPKDKLRSESFIERINWYYRDLEKWPKVAAHFILLLIIASTLFGVYYLFTNFSDNDEVMEIVGIIVTAILGFFGISIQALTLRTPRK